jgi:dolichol-phosphate mannosyltransferase
MEKVVVITPTYNEAENIAAHIDKLQEVFKKVPAKWEMHILIVDDTSPDGTADVVREKMKTYKNVHLFMNKEKVGLGGAYMKGMRYAIDKLKADLLFEMDADFQHDPDLIPEFLKKIDQGADIVIGSRYMRGGSIPKHWGLMRKFLSVGGNLFIRVMMLEKDIHDWTTGFRALRPWVYEKVHKKITELKTYSFQISFLYYARKEGAKVAEVPLKFRKRRKGESKLPGIEGTVKTFWFVIKTRAFDLLRSRFFKFGIVGFLGFLVNFVFLRVFRGIGLPEVLAWLFSTELAIINNYVLNNIWTFQEAKIAGLRKTVIKFLEFNLTSAGALIIQSIFGPLGVKIVGVRYDYFVLAFVVLFMVLPYNYFMYNTVIWKTWKLPWKKKK